MKFSLSRILSVIALIGSVASGAAVYVGALNPKYGAVLSTIGAAIASFNERIHGGLSDPAKRLDAQTEANNLK